MTRRVLVTVSGDAVHGRLCRGPKVVREAERGFSALAELETAAAEVVAELRGGERSIGVAVELTPPLVQLRRLTGLPPVRAGVLPRLVAAQAPRFFRSARSRLVTNAAWRQPNVGREPRVVSAAAADEDVLEAIIRGASGAGGRLVSIAPGGSLLQLWPERERAIRSRAARRRTAMLAAATALLWLMAGAASLYRVERDARYVNAELERLAAPHAAVVTARREFEAASAMVETLEGVRARGGQLVLALGHALTTLPDSAYLSSIHLTDADTGVNIRMSSEMGQ